MKLATWRYKHDLTKTRIGIIIDDNAASHAVDSMRDMVDVYGYTSLVVAAVQAQAREIQALREELNQVKQECSKPAKR